MDRMEAVLAAGAPWLVAALISAEIGLLQMTQAGRMGMICGLPAAQGRCPACYVALALLAVGVLAMRSRWSGREVFSWTG